MTEPVVLFDGTCNFCNGAVRFIVDRERGHALRFASLQSDVARDLLTRAVGEPEAKKIREGVDGSGDPDTVVLVEDDRAYTHSAAAMRITRYLRAPWRWLVAFAIVPRPIRDAVYRWFARHRYGWFGKTDMCRTPTPELRARFLE